MKLSWLCGVIPRMRKPKPVPHEQPSTLPTLLDLLEGQIKIIERMEHRMSDLSDRIATLTQAVADNTTATDAAVAKIGSGTPSDAADVAAAVTALDAANTQIATNTASLNNAQPPA
jgi:hypothetical protein